MLLLGLSCSRRGGLAERGIFRRGLGPFFHKFEAARRTALESHEAKGVAVVALLLRSRLGLGRRMRLVGQQELRPRRGQQLQSHVVGTPFGRVGQHMMRSGDPFEGFYAKGVLRIPIGMQLQCELAVRALQCVTREVTLQPQYVVVRLCVDSAASLGESSGVAGDGEDFKAASKSTHPGGVRLANSISEQKSNRLVDVPKCLQTTFQRLLGTRLGAVAVLLNRLAVHFFFCFWSLNTRWRFWVVASRQLEGATKNNSRRRLGNDLLLEDARGAWLLFRGNSLRDLVRR